MGAADNILKYWSIFVDGRGLAGNEAEFTPPKLTEKTEDFEGGGLDVAIEVPMGMEKLACDFTLTKYDPNVLALWGLGSSRDIQIVAKGSVEDLNGKDFPITHVCRGSIKELDPGSWGKGKVSHKYAMTLTYYRHEFNGKVIHEIDVPNMVRIINGVDVLAKHRSNIGLS